MALDEEGKMNRCRGGGCRLYGINSEQASSGATKQSGGRGGDETPGPPTFNVFLFILSSLGLLLFFLSGSAMT